MSANPSTEQGPAPAVDAEIARLRAKISSNDRAMLDLVVKRVDLVGQIWERKLGRRITLIDPAREVELLTELCVANHGRLSTAGLSDFHAALLTLTKRELERRFDPL